MPPGLPSGRMDDDLRTAERRLQAAQLASDVTELDALLDDAALFTGPDGTVLAKADDLRAHRDGAQVLRRSEELELRTRVAGPTGVTWVLVALEGETAGEAFAARVRYTRTWAHDDGAGWQVLAAHASVVG
ncbi:hypothetical protein FRP1_24735 [Pseudonocardia sp. EC080625-04]|nr:hypothetical protein FRP1_24735 [Pseudonocardia sp. EC080625-04]